MESDQMFMPLSVNMENKNVVVIGAGKVATRRIMKFLEYGVKMSVVSPVLNEELKLIRDQFSWVNSFYYEGCIKNADFVIASTDKEDLNNKIRIDCNTLKIPCLDVSNGKMSDFHLPAVVKKGSIQISISTQGKSPGIAKKLRTDLDQWLEDEWVQRLSELATIRELIKLKIPVQEEREKILKTLTDLPIEELILRRKQYED
jgi:precorrin-2 dehydrogenase/sirohydrochlorin ferrochelatase